MTLYRMNIKIVLSTLAIFFIISCKDERESYYQEMTNTKMTAYNFKIDSIESRTTLTPSDSGTSFFWNEGDVVGVYSDAKGLTNFFINPESISEDKTSAEFNGSGFSLQSNNTYYAFYPYEKASLDKTNIPLSYEGQAIAQNGDFKSLGNYDYMYAKGVTNNTGHVNFQFSHIGCVTEFKIKSPADAIYTGLYIETDSTSTTRIIKSGTIDITEDTPKIKTNEESSYGQGLKISFNSDKGFYTAKDTTLTIYMMMAPQDLSNCKMILKLIDNNDKWYSAELKGKNMRAGYTYRYVIGEDGDSGFTGNGTGLPFEDLSLSLISTYSHLGTAKGYEDLYKDNNYAYATGEFGIRKIDYSNPISPTLICENSTFTDKNIKAKSITGSGNYLYINMRQNSSGATELYTPKERLTFETGITQFTSEKNPLSDNQIINNFFQKLYIKSLDARLLTRAYIYKAFYENGVYRNIIRLDSSNGKSILFKRKDYSTKEAALKDLEETYTTTSGDYCIVNWDALSSSCNCPRAFSIHDKNGSITNKISNNDVINNFFTSLHLNSMNLANLKSAYIYKGLYENGVYRNIIRFDNTNGYSIVLLRKEYATLEEALASLETTYSTEDGDYCTVDWNALKSSYNHPTNLEFYLNGSFDSYEQYNATIKEIGEPCPNTGLLSCQLETQEISDNAKAVLRKKINSSVNYGSISFWICIQNKITKPVDINLLEDLNKNTLSLLLSPSEQIIKLGLSIQQNDYHSNYNISYNEWYNLKINFNEKEISMYIRSKEAGDWHCFSTTTNNNALTQIAALLVGIETTASNVTINLDDYYYDTSDIDNVSYLNGKILILNKQDLSIEKTMNLNLKGTGIKAYKNRLVVNFLNGFNVYDITNPTDPQLKFTHRPSHFKEYQGLDIYESNGQIYAILMNYNYGVTIVNITNLNNIQIIKEDDFSDFVASDGYPLKWKSYTWDVIVDYPYAYITNATLHTSLGISEEDRRGIVAVNLSNVSKLEKKLFEIPKEIYSSFSGDPAPTSISKFKSWLLINNAEKGICIFKILNEGTLNYEKSVTISPNSRVSFVKATSGNQIFVGDGSKACQLYLYKTNE